jgi:large subunit ribosomal protein L17
MFRNLAANLIAHERVETTDAKAKEIRRITERLITKATRLGKVAFTKAEELSPADKAKRLHVTRLLGSFLPRFGVRADGTKVDLVEKVLVDLAKRFEGRPGGYTRIIKASIRRGDAAPLSFIEFVDAAPIADKPKADQPTAPTEAAATG